MRGTDDGEITGVAKKLVDGFCDAGEGRVVIVVNNNRGVRRHVRSDEFETVANRFVEIAVEEGESDLVGQVARREVGKPCFFDDRHTQAGFFEADNQVGFGCQQFPALEVVADE